MMSKFSSRPSSKNRSGTLTPTTVRAEGIIYNRGGFVVCDHSSTETYQNLGPFRAFHIVCWIDTVDTLGTFESHENGVSVQGKSFSREHNQRFLMNSCP